MTKDAEPTAEFRSRFTYCACAIGQRPRAALPVLQEIAGGRAAGLGDQIGAAQNVADKRCVAAIVSRSHSQIYSDDWARLKIESIASFAALSTRLPSSSVPIS